VEHPILWCDCPAHLFHIPVYARAIIRDIHTLEPLPMGEKGLVNLLTPMIKAVPVSSIMTDDIGFNPHCTFFQSLLCNECHNSS